MRTVGTMLLLVLWTGCGGGEPNSPPPASHDPPQESEPHVSRDVLEARIEELRTVVRTLAEENRRLREDLAARSASPAPAQPAQPAPPTPQSPGTPAPEIPPATSGPAPPEPPPEPSASILYVNPHWHYIVVNRGAEAGLKPKQRLRVLRDGREIATAIVTETKPRQAVADLEVDRLDAEGRYPRKHDAIAIQ